ncbi:MAG: glycerate kinase, partial [Saprospiraceae bacterium]|nr:glycerate kinase [Saprospiraceae bacterium]
LHLQDAIKGADLVITGEGKLDDQTLSGKAIGGVVKLAADLDKPVIAICGQLGLSGSVIQEMGLGAAFSVQRGIRPLREAMVHTMEDLEECSRQIIHVFRMS